MTPGCFTRHFVQLCYVKWWILWYVNFTDYSYARIAILGSLAVDQDRMRQVGYFPVWDWCFEFHQMLCHCSLSDKKGIQSTKNSCHLSPNVLSWNKCWSKPEGGNGEHEFTWKTAVIVHMSAVSSAWFKLFISRYCTAFSTCFSCVTHALLSAGIN